MKKLAIALFGISTVLGAPAFAETTPEQATTSPQQVSANYQCDQGEQVTVNYAINQSGIPTEASFEVEGNTQQLSLDQASTNEATVAFSSDQGYNLTASVPTENTPFAQTVSINTPANDSAYQNCTAVGQG